VVNRFLVSLLIVFGAVVPIMMFLDSVTSKYHGQRPVWRELFSRSFWSGMGSSMTSKVNEWADEHDAAEAAKKARLEKGGL